MMNISKRAVARMAVSVSAMMVAGASYADTAVVDDVQSGFPQTTGKQLYESICLSCHMAGGKGAQGAGSYPALANNPKLAAAGYPLYMVMYGQKAMPGFGGVLNNAQIAEVVNYVRSNFGNRYDDTSTAADAKALRKPGYQHFTLN